MPRASTSGLRRDQRRRHSGERIHRSAVAGPGSPRWGHSSQAENHGVARSLPVSGAARRPPSACHRSLRTSRGFSRKARSNAVSSRARRFLAGTLVPLGERLRERRQPLRCERRGPARISRQRLGDARPRHVDLLPHVLPALRQPQGPASMDLGDDLVGLRIGGALRQHGAQARTAPTRRARARPASPHGVTNRPADRRARPGNAADRSPRSRRRPRHAERDAPPRWALRTRPRLQRVGRVHQLALGHLEEQPVIVARGAGERADQAQGSPRERARDHAPERARARRGVRARLAGLQKN